VAIVRSHGRKLACAAAVVLAASLLAGPGPAGAARHHHHAKPSIKVLGISVNQFYAKSGSKVKNGDSTNACYIIGGASGEPDQLVAYVYVKAVKVPPDAHLTYKFSTPWDAEAPEQASYDGRFSGRLFKTHGHPQASIYHGPTGPSDYFSYRMLPTGTPASYYISGKYSLSVSVRVNGRTLASAGAIDIAC
jgi:hypothetical protein